MKKVFVDIYLNFNLGDDLFLDILLSKYPNTQFTINYLGNDYNDFISGYTNVQKRKYTLINKIGQRLKISDSITNYDRVAEEHDTLIFIGGSIFREEDYHKDLYRDRVNLVTEFRKRTKPVYVLGANFGPFHSERFLEDYRHFFLMCEDVCFRDLYSYQLFKELDQVRYAQDIVFGLNVDEFKTIKPVLNRVGLSIIDVTHKQGLSHYQEEYFSTTIAAIEALVERGYECYLMSFCEGEGDLNIIRKMVGQLKNTVSNKVHVFNYTGNLKEAISLIASFNLLIAARFHANILALLLEVGLLPIIYSPKTENMLSDLQLDKLLIRMDQLSLQVEASTLIKAINNKVSSNTFLDKTDQFEKLNEFLFKDQKLLKRV
ncbi:polysaccharide pyruvyl transferase family protein [Peribacillus sp. SCS-37]|uniref:polysaccharide pyruvyl transferase family protein n=1 Tax=Paraperibacillus esterisolvens TaxID=3115296 RepID=UPI0039065B77